MTKTPFAAIEIGTSKVCALVGEPREDGNIMITGMGNCPSCGQAIEVAQRIEPDPADADLF